MSLHVEAICDNLRDFLQLNLPAQIEVVGAEPPTGPTAGISAPLPMSYFLGERDVYRAYEPPAVFIMPQRSVEGRGRDDMNVTLPLVHRIVVGVLMEGTGQQELTRSCMRMIQAVTNVLRDNDITPQGITNRSTKVKIDSVDYGVSYGTGPLDNTTFRREVWVNLNVMHWDQLTPVPIQIPTLGAGYIEVGQIGTTSAVLGAVTESQLTTTSATNVLTATTGTNPGSYMVSVYYRCTAATDLTITVAWQDATGNQSMTLVTGTQQISSNTVDSMYITCNGGIPINVQATASVANVAFVSATIWKAF